VTRICARCQRPFTREDFVTEESKGLEAERKAFGLAGVKFLYYTCPACGDAAIFLDLFPLDGETVEEFAVRRQALEVAVQQFHADKAQATVTVKAPAKETE
jgi:hypothetical protein